MKKLTENKLSLILLMIFIIIVVLLFAFNSDDKTYMDDRIDDGLEVAQGAPTKSGLSSMIYVTDEEVLKIIADTRKYMPKVMPNDSFKWRKQGIIGHGY